jgi:hypothetical protein
MNAESFKKVCPGVLEDEVTVNTNVYYDEVIGFPGSWTILVRNNKITEASYWCNASEMNESKLSFCFTQAKKIVTTKIGPFANERSSLEATEEKPGSKIVNQLTWKTAHALVTMELYKYYYRGSEKDSLLEESGFSITLTEELNNSPRDWNYYPGMHAKEFSRKNPKLLPAGELGYTGNWKKQDTLFGLPGSWLFHFNSNMLTYFTFDYSYKEYSKEILETCLKRTEEAIAYYEKLFGLPYSENKFNNFPPKETNERFDRIIRSATWKRSENFYFVVHLTARGNMDAYEILFQVKSYTPDR